MITLGGISPLQVKLPKRTHMDKNISKHSPASSIFEETHFITHPKRHKQESKENEQQGQNTDTEEMKQASAPIQITKRKKVLHRKQN